MGEIKPGVLAMVVGCYNDPSDIGKIVHVERLSLRGEKSPDGGEFGDDQGWLCTGDNIKSYPFEFAGWCYYATQHLMPINPSADPLEQTQEQEQTA